SESTRSGRAAPPEMQVRKLRVAPGAASDATPSNAEYIVGTPAKTVTPSRSITSRTSRGSKQGISVNVASANTQVSPTVKPKTWNSGKQPITTSSGPVSTTDRAQTSALRPRPAWVRLRPLG